MKNSIRGSAAFGLACFLFTVLSAGCSRVEEPVLPPIMPTDSSPTFDPLMASARDWLQVRKYVYATNVEDDVTSFQTYFADLPGDADSASCFIHNGTNGDTLILNARLSPMAGKSQSDQVNSWVAEANSHSQWGFFGLDDEDRRVWFRIALFRPAGKVTAEDMDRLVNEVIGAIHQWRGFIEENDVMETLTSDTNNANPPDDQLRGIQKAKPATAPPKSILINYIEPVNYVRLKKQKK